MKKLLFFLVFTLCLSFITQAGYIIRGTQNFGRPTRLENYTLTFDRGNTPVCAASMRTGYAPGIGTMKNTIVIINSRSNTSIIFPVVLGEEGVNIEVRDFHYIRNDKYILCGSRQIGYDTCAFVATIDWSTLTMNFFEYPNADVFYSICPNEPALTPSPGIPATGYYACGAKNDKGVIVHLHRTTLQALRMVETLIPWVYHKIISYRNPAGAIDEPHFVVSGRNPAGTFVGFTEIDRTLAVHNSYYWLQPTEQAAHCVVTNYAGENNKIVIGTSYNNTVALLPITIPPTFPIPAYRFYFGSEYNFYIQDIGMIPDKDVTKPLISVAGYMKENSGATWRQAWFGYMLGLSGSSIMYNNNYGAQSGNDQYEHYKIGFYNSVPYTGGKFSENGFPLCALFGSPTRPADVCDNLFVSLMNYPFTCIWSQFYLVDVILEPAIETPVIYNKYELSYYADCMPFKGGDDDPEYSMLPPENESEITNFYDRITIKDTPSGTNYQIFSVTGQLIQTGTTNPDIPTAQLTKGMYILRLETGKAVKFVK